MKNLCKWAVVFKIDGSNYDDKEEITSVVAVFLYLYQARDFIEKCLPIENINKFSVVDIDTL